MYKVLYRKYRPNNFNEVVGQETTVQILKNSIINEKISHAYIFAGPRGTGKTSMARIFAKAINCQNPKDGEACGECINCQNFNNSPDIIEIDAASNNGVDEIRELINNVKLMPTSSKYKVYIIDEVHMLSQSAFNALLLTLEEPPSHVIFILATTNIESVPITILSRCQKYEFFRINDSLIANHLEKICKTENIEYDREGLQEITSLADGGLRDALSMLDQLSKEKTKIDLNFVIKELGSISLVKIKDLVNSLDANDLDKTLAIIGDLKKTNLNYKIVIKKIIEILSQKAVDVLQNGSSKYLTYSEIKRIILELNDCLNKININVNPYIIVQMILLDSFSLPTGPNPEPKQESKKEAKEEVKPTVREEKIQPETPKEEKVATKLDVSNIKKIRVNNCFVAADKDILNKLKNDWSQLLNLASAPIKGLISDTMPVAASKEFAIIACSVPHQDQEINENLEKIENEFQSIFKKSYKFIGLTVADWQKEKEEYIVKIKSGYKYELLDESKLDNQTVDMERIAKDLFNKEKIEIN